MLLSVLPAHQYVLLLAMAVDAEHQEAIVRSSFCPMRQMSGIVNVFEWFRDCSACRVRGKLVYNRYRVLESTIPHERGVVLDDNHS